MLLTGPVATLRGKQEPPSAATPEAPHAAAALRRPLFSGCATSIAYFPAHKVVLCTVPMSSSSTWRELARRIHAMDKDTPDSDTWCGSHRGDFHGCLLDQSEAPPGVHNLEMLKRLVEKEHYTPAVFLRDPLERAFSMYTDTVDAGGPDPLTTTFPQFVSQLEAGSYALNQHMAPQMKLCNFGRSRNESGIPWKLSSSTPRWPLDSSQTTRRAHRFVGELFGNKVLKEMKSNWTQCPLKGFSSDDFFIADAVAAPAPPPMTRDLRRRIDAIYAEDREAYLEAQTDGGGQDQGGDAGASESEADEGEVGSDRGPLPALESMTQMQKKEFETASSCSTCGTNENGISNCCSIGGSWADRCSVSTSEGSEHTWVEGWEACNDTPPTTNEARLLNGFFAASKHLEWGPEKEARLRSIRHPRPMALVP